jgi:hypothetical protein
LNNKSEVTILAIWHVRLFFVILICCKSCPNHEFENRMILPSSFVLNRGLTVIPSFATSIFAFVLHCSLPASRFDLADTTDKMKLWDGTNIDHIKEAATALRSGKPVAFPTETVYGLGAIASDDEAVSRVFQAKGRPSDNPLIVHVADGEAGLRRVALGGKPPEIALKLGRRFWPGPLSICILANKDEVGSKTRAGLDTVAVRKRSRESLAYFSSYAAARILQACSVRSCATVAHPAAGTLPPRELSREILDSTID